MVLGGAVPAAALGATLSMNPSGGTYQTGNIITAQIMLNTQGAPIEGVDIRYLNYNPMLLEVQDENSSIAGVQIAPGTLMQNTVANTVDTTLGRITFSQVISGNTTFNGSGALASVRFRVLAPGSANVVFNFTPGNTADTNIASAGTDVLTSVTNAAYVLTAPPAQQLAPIVYLSPSSTVKVTGEPFSLAIMLDTRGSAIDGADIVLSYNRAFMKIVDADGGKDGVQITPGSLMPNTVTNDVIERSGRILFSQTTAASGTFTGSGVLATITARATAPGAANLTFGFVKGRTNDTNVSLGGNDLLDTVTNATVQIVENNAAPIITGIEPSGVIALPPSLTLKVSTNEWATCRYASAPGVDYATTRGYFFSPDGVEHSATMRAGFHAGLNNFYVRCRDKVGNVMNTDAVISFFITVDTAAPFITQASPSGVLFSPNNIRISVAPQDQSGVAACKYSVTPNTEYDLKPRALYASYTSNGVFSASISSYYMHIGQNNFYVRCKDKAGNTNAFDTVISFTLVASPKFLVSAEGYNNAREHIFSISLFSPNSTEELASIKARPDDSGAIALTFDPTRGSALVGPGNYDVRIVSDRYLKRKISNMYIAGGAVIQVPSLLAGDLNGDGVINSIDWSIMDTQWAKTSSFADINKDRMVNSLDWGYIRKNWMQTGN